MKAGSMGANLCAWLGAAGLAAAVGAGCGIEVGGGGGAVTTAGGGTGGTGITSASVSFGSVTAFGSIFVNGVEYATNGATIVRDDVAIAESELRVGMTVEVRGVRDDATRGVAHTVRVEEAVRGVVESRTGNRLVVLGQNIAVDETTHFDDNLGGADAIAVGDPIEVHGLLQAPGAIEATFVQRKAEPLTFVVRGFIVDHDAQAAVFKVGALPVSYAVAVTDAMPAGSWNGLLVEVQGATCAARPVCGTLSASHVRPDGLEVGEAEQAEVEGFVTGVISEGRFMLGNQAVVTDAATNFSGGTVADVVAGAKLEVEGRLSGGALIADKVTLKHNVRLESSIVRLDSAAGAVTLAAFSGIRVITNEHTRFKGGLRSLADLAVGDGVRIRGRTGPGGSVIVIDVHRDHAANNEAVLQGPLLAFTNPSITILGITIDTSAVQEFKDGNGRTVSSAVFFDSLRAGALVKARGRPDGVDRVVWLEIEIED
jgi:Domain of unknown function (DUF5666)